MGRALDPFGFPGTGTVRSTAPVEDPTCISKYK